MAKNSPIRIEVWRGLVSEVRGIPKGFHYTIIDKDKLEEPSGEDAETEFSMMIRERMTNEEFWEWVKSWKDPTVLIQDAEGWDIKTKEEEIKKMRDIVSKVN